jgi:hypothetical protein
LLHAWFLPFEVDFICRIPLYLLDVPDLQVWDYINNGEYSVKSGYKALSLARSPSANASSSNAAHTLWQSLWNLSIPLKIKHFLWR